MVRKDETLDMTKQTTKPFINLYTGRKVTRQALNFRDYKNEISYSDQEFATPRTVVRGAWHGYHFTIQDNGIFPLAYVALPPSHPYYKLPRKDPAFMDLGMHGGICTAGPMVPRAHSRTTSNRWWIGWRYAEMTDYASPNSPYYSGYPDAKKWTREEIIRDVKDVIRKLDAVK